VDPLEPGVAVDLAKGLCRLVAPNPGLMTGPGTNTYLLGEGDLVVVDPGPDDEAHLEAIEAVASARSGRIRYVAVTHTHPDHAPGAASLAAATGAVVLGFGERPGFVPEGVVADGDVVAAGGSRLRAIHTPGHASDHLCYLEERTNILLSGDHIMGGSTVVIAPPDGDMAQYMDSLQRLLAIDPPIAAIAPGHGPLMTDPPGVINGYIAHRMARETAILDALQRRREATVAELVADVYTDVPAALHPIAAHSVWAHLRKLTDESLVATADRDDLAGVWRAAR
jgi:glyoxylase-like metal-dependent hydrolase (beta-lactamase superfamily II)